MTKRRTQQVRVIGTPKTARYNHKFTLVNSKSGKLWCPVAANPEQYPQVGRWIQCIDYDNHFLALNPEYVRGVANTYFAYCSCGSPAVLVGYNAYKDGASVSTHGDTMGEMIVCHVHANTGKHVDGST